jgi:hypothetical protein
MSAAFMALIDRFGNLAHLRLIEAGHFNRSLWVPLCLHFLQRAHASAAQFPSALVARTAAAFVAPIARNSALTR